MNMKNCDFKDIVWTHRTHGYQSNADISIRICKDGSLNFTFRNNVFTNITTTQYLQIGILDGALLFKEADRTTGYKATYKDKTGHYHLVLRNKELTDWCEEYNGAGDYTARMFRRYIYIEPDTKRTEEKK